MGFTRHAFPVEGHTLRLAKVGALPIIRSRELPAEPGSITIMKDAAGCSLASFVVEVERPTLEPQGKSAGIDPGFTSLAVTSEGKKTVPPGLLRSALQRIRRLSRDPSRQVKGSHNRRKARLRLAKAHARWRTHGWILSTSSGLGLSVGTQAGLCYR